MRLENTEICTSRRPFVVALRHDAGDAHVGRQRRLELVQQFGPRKRPAIDQRVGLARGRLHDASFSLSIERRITCALSRICVACASFLRDRLPRVAALRPAAA